jgi:hypothetical protein
MNTQQQPRKMRYRTFIVLSSVGTTVFVLICTALLWLYDPGNPFIGWLVVLAIGLGVLNAISLLLAWRFNRAYIEQLGFRRW